MKIYHNALTEVKVTSKYGKRKHPITGEEGKMHYGTDLISDAGDKNIYALEDGYVQKTVKNQSKATTGFGNYIWVRYPRINRSIIYAHCKSIKLKKGDKVKKGTIIAIMGSTGASTGVHVHLGMTEIGKDTWLNTDTYNYQPPVEKVEVDPVVDDKELKIQELENAISALEAEIEGLKADLIEASSFKFMYKVPKDGLYEIKLKQNETLYVK